MVTDGATVLIRFGDLLFREFVSTPRRRPSLIRFFAPYCNLMPCHGSNRRRCPYRIEIDGLSEKNMNAPRESRRRGPALAFLLLRLTLGLNIGMHGVSRIAAGPATFADSIVPMFLNTPLPAWSVHVFGLVLPWAEAILGLLLLLGFCTRFALVAGSLLILILTFGTTLRQDWSTAGVQLVYTAVYSALLALDRWNDYSLDRLLSLRHPSMRSFGK
jgi:thiosulfate dehydrogenase (quinone) large subunit